VNVSAPVAASTWKIEIAESETAREKLDEFRAKRPTERSLITAR